MSKENYNEKVSVNINSSTLSQIDLLVDNGYYSNRSDFINQSLREGLQKHQSSLDRIIENNINLNPKRWFIGACSLNNHELQTAKQYGHTLKYSGYGVLVIDKDIDENLLFSVVESIKVKGKIVCSQTIKTHYGLK